MYRRLESKIYLIEIIDDFLNFAIELRRYEKDYFLYHDEEDYERNLSYLELLETSLETNKDNFAVFLRSATPALIDKKLKEYREGITHLHELGGPHSRDAQQFVFELEIREIGHELTRLAKELAKNERESIDTLIEKGRTALIVSITIFVVLSLSLAILLGKRIVSSLKLLEEYTRSISRKEKVYPPIRKMEPEIHSLVKALNRMDNELALRQRQMVQSEKLISLGRLLIGVAHELNNPLSNISLLAQILADEFSTPDPDYHPKIIGQMIEQTDKAKDIIRTLLEFSRTKEFNKERLGLKQLLLETIKLLHSEVPNEIELSVDVPPSLSIMADKQKMQQVFLNLIKNSVDAIEHEGWIRISSKESLSDKKEKVIEIQVSDNGSGIEPDKINKIFDPFYTTKEEGKGSGLGLSIVHDIIELHGGTISVNSRLGEGTTFIIWLLDR